MLSIISPRDNSIAKGRQVNEFLEKPYEKNILPSKHCNYGSIHINTEESKMLADNLICARINKLDKKC